MKCIISSLLLGGFLVVAAMSASLAAAKVYTLVYHAAEFDDSPYGFSGTITTDGTFGLKSDLSFITDWNITLETPGQIDGISTQTLTPTNGSSIHLSMGSSLSGHSGTLSVTPTSLSMLFAGRYSPSVFRLRGPAPGDEAISFVGPFFSLPPGLLTAHGDGNLGFPIRGEISRGYCYIEDLSEVPNRVFGQAHGALGHIFATAVVPEPSSLVLWSLLGVVSATLRRTRHFLSGVRFASRVVESAART